ncbi:MAG: hypothetical protein LBR15_01795 [Methanobrevibacter sp.]|jgi:hypothetical protein|nr:hypothetical protein [Candidatus Methanovirga australis]
MMKKISAISLILLLLGCSVSAVSARHYSNIYAHECKGNLLMYNGDNQQTWNWDFNCNGNGGYAYIWTEGYRKVDINPLGWNNPHTYKGWNYFPDNLNMGYNGQGGIDLY